MYAEALIFIIAAKVNRWKSSFADMFVIYCKWKRHFGIFHSIVTGIEHVVYITDMLAVQRRVVSECFEDRLRAEYIF